MLALVASCAVLGGQHHAVEPPRVSISRPELTLDLPPIPLTEVLLAVLIYLLWRCLTVLEHGVALLGEIREGSGGGVRHNNVFGKLQRSTRPSPMTKATPPQLHSSPPQDTPTHRPALTPLSRAPAERFLRDSAQAFAECLLDEGDVDVSRFLRACRHFATVLEKAGPFTMLSIRETQSNIQKMEHTCAHAPPPPRCHT